MSMSPCEATLLPFGNFRMVCGDGEDGGKTTTTETDNGDGTTSTSETTTTETPDLESQLDEERQARITLQRERDEAAETAQQAIREGQEEGDRVAAERDDFKKKYEKLKGLMETSYLTNAISRQYVAPDEEGKGGKGFDFHDPEGVRTFINPKNIRLDLDTGKVEGLDQELKRIAREKPYLVKEAKADENGGGAGNFTPPPGNSGSHPRNGSARVPETDSKKLGAKYKMPGFSGAGVKF